MQKTAGWTIKWDTQQQVPYAYKSTLWVGYDNIDSIKQKVISIICSVLIMGNQLTFPVESNYIF
jgi:GH18 family chitinase